MSDQPASIATTTPQPPRLLDQLRAAAIGHGFPEAVANDFVLWSRRYILFHGTRHPRELAEGEVGQFLAHLARSEPDPLPILDRVQRALEFLYGEVLCRPLGEVALPRPPRLLDQIRQVLRVRHYSPRTEDCYVQWAIRFIRFHGLRHPRDLGAAEVERFLTDLAVNGNVAASTQNQALNALVFLYKQVLDIDLGRFDAVRARRGKRLPVVLSPDEVRQVLNKVEGGDGVFRLMAQLLYGCGLRLAECCRLRVHDIDLGRSQIVVRGGKGDKDRVVMLPRSTRPGLEGQLDARRTLHDRDVAQGVARVELPAALERCIRAPRRRSSGSLPLPRVSFRPVPGAGGAGDITFTTDRFSASLPRPAGPQSSTGRFTATRSATALPRTLLSEASTSARSRCFSATRAWRRR